MHLLDPSEAHYTFTNRYMVEGEPLIEQLMRWADPDPKEQAMTKAPKDITEIPTQTRAISWNRQWLTVKELRNFLNQIPDQALIEVVGSQGDTGRIVATWETPT